MLVPFSNLFDVYGQSEFDTEEMGLGMPEITMTPTSGQPGTQIQIKVTNMPSAPKNIDPRMEFFVYLPFLSSIGSNVPSNCGDERCFPLYSFEEVGAQKFAPKTITFTLFSTTNPPPVVEGGWMNSVCDLKINGNTIERYGKACIDNDQPSGNYEIKFGWGIQRSDLYDIRKTLNFTVLEKELIPQQVQQDEEDIIISQYQNGTISELEFEQKLTDLGYDQQMIRQAKALIGKLEHQQGIQTPLKEPIKIQGTDYELTYLISGGIINQVTPDTEAQSLIVQIESISNGTLSINLPRKVIDAKFGQNDDDFFVLVDGVETSFEETKTNTARTLTIDYPKGTEEIEIIGTSVVPEFGIIPLLILSISVLLLVMISNSKIQSFFKIYSYRF